MSKDVFEIKQDKKNEPLVSVGIMAYNRPEGLRQTLECITSQTYKNLQITVSNNCSTDPRVEQIMLEYASKDSRIVPFSQIKNMGVGYNWRFVLDKSVGEYFMWAADDDYWESEYIEEMLSLLQNNKQAVVAFCAIQEKENSLVTDCMDKCLGLVSPNVNKRLISYMSWPDGANVKGSILYGLHRRESIRFCFYEMWPHNPKSLGTDIIILYLLLIKGPVVFSHKVLYTVTMKNVKYVGFVYKKGEFIGSSILLLIRKAFDTVFEREKFYFLVSRTMWKSGASKICFFYSLYIIVIRHLHALWAIIRFPFKKIMCQK